MVDGFGLSEDGQVTYTAEKGDNMSTFRQQYGLNAKTAGQILGKSGITNDNQIKAGKLLFRVRQLKV